MGVVLMTKAEARTDQIYQITMSMAKKLLSEGKITKEDYRQFDTKMQKKYPPVFGDLFWGERQK